jgi:hypothetical protein
MRTYHWWAVKCQRLLVNIKTGHGLANEYLLVQIEPPRRAAIDVQKKIRAKKLSFSSPIHYLSFYSLGTGQVYAAGVLPDPLDNTFHTP